MSDVRKTLDEWLDVCWDAFNEFRECREKRCSETKELSEWARCYNDVRPMQPQNT